MLEIELGRLKHDTGYKQEIDLARPCDTAAYDYPELSLAAPLRFCGQAENVHGEIHLQGEIIALINLVCSRCCAGLVTELSLPFHEIYTAQPTPADIDGEQDKHAYSGHAIDITPEALRLIFPELPMKPVCQEDCQGLCPICGLNLNDNSCSCQQEDIDPRWEALKNLL